jgi:hypothetical protein
VPEARLLSRLVAPPFQRAQKEYAMSVHEQRTEHKTFTMPDVIREFPNGKAEILAVGGAEVGRLVFRPGWRWSTDVQPLAKTSSCEAPHFQYHVSGKLGIRMDDGTEIIAGPGDITSLPKGHDAWVIGDEPVVVVDWFGATNYAKTS